MKIQQSVLFFLSFILFSCQAQNHDNYENVTPLVFAEKMKATPEAQVIDVRTPEEFSSQHIDRAVNINWNGDDFVAQAQKLDKTKPVFVYCMVGGRSKKASNQLAEMGFAKVYDLQGGIMKWNAAGLSKPSDKIVGMCSQEFGDLLKADQKVLINFYADWCATCKKMSPYIKEMQADLKGKINVVRLNADENKTLISELKIDELPALLYYERATLKWKHLGFMSEDDLKKQLQ